MTYLTPEAAAARLTAIGIASTPTAPLLTLASDEVDAAGPFIGGKTVFDQPRQFPRFPDTTVPDAVLDYVALRAAELSIEPEAPVTSEGAGGVSVSYATPKKSRLQVLRESAGRSVGAYALRVGSLR